MPYSAQIVARARQKLAEEKENRQSRYRMRLQEAYAAVPKLRQLDVQIRSSMSQAAQAVFTQGGDPVAAMEAVKRENLALQQERRVLVEEYFPQGWLDEEPVCAACGGTGYLGSHMCNCLRRLCAREQKKEIAQLTTGAERFDTFRLEYYPDRVYPDYGVNARQLMQRNLAYCRDYADGFAPDARNLLFVGGTGLGKTFLSACIANVVADKGYSIAYESAPQLFAKLEKNRFAPDEASHLEAEKFAACDLLIVDDLGTEMPGNFVTAALYSLVNDRLLSGKPMIVSTNLTVEEIAQRYNPQIASRFQGSFKRLTFVGEDIRVQKSREY